MVWKLAPAIHETFERNPLTAVIAQLQFHPILKVPERLPDFQDRVRARFPVFAEVTTREVRLQSPFGIEVKESKEFHFKKSDGSATLTLGPAAIALENRHHQSRDLFLDDMKLAVDSLLGVFSSVASTRLGLRYVNLIRKDEISEALSRKVEWTDLVDSRFITMPDDLADIEDTLFATEVRTRVGDGMMTMRAGLLQDPADQQEQFRLDIDRYKEVDLDISAIVGLLRSFADDVYALFRSAAGPSLLQWMSKARAKSTTPP